MKVIKHFDIPFFLVSLALLCIGLVMCFSTSSIVGFQNYNDSYYFIRKDIVYLFLGSIGMVLGYIIPPKTYQKMAMWGFFFAVFILILTLVPGIKVSLGGATRWIRIGGLQIQPVEIAKFFISVFIATSLVNKAGRLSHFLTGLLPILILLLIPLGILARQPDLGNAILIGSVSFVAIFLADSRLVHLGTILSLGITGIVVNILTHPYQMHRVKTFLDPWSDPLGQSYHIIQSLIAVGSGGFFGVGIGQSKLKYHYLPLHYSDFIFAIVCEEGGFILGAAVILLLGFFFWRGFRVSVTSPVPFEQFLGVQLILYMVAQAFINIGMVIGMLPVTGIPLTFISFGGTSLVSSMFCIGVILRISRRVESPLVL